MNGLESNLNPSGQWPPRRRSGYSLLEVMLASAICAAALVPALAVLRDGIQTVEDIDTKHLLLLYGVQTMEDRMSKVAALADASSSWSPGSDSGNFASQGFASLRYTATWTNEAVGNGLMTVTVTTYHDKNGNSALGADEPRVVLTTKVAKLSTYGTKAGS